MGRKSTWLTTYVTSELTARPPRSTATAPLGVPTLRVSGVETGGGDHDRFREGAGEPVGGTEDGGDAFDVLAEVGGYLVGRWVARYVGGGAFEADDVAAEVSDVEAQ